MSTKDMYVYLFFLIANDGALSSKTSTLKENLLSSGSYDRNKMTLVSCGDETSVEEKESLESATNTLSEKVPYYDGDKVISNPNGETEEANSLI